MNDQLASGRRRRWAVDLGARRLRLVDSLAELRELIEQDRVTPTTRVFELGAGPTVLSDVPGLERMFPRARTTTANVDDGPPPIRARGGPPPRPRRTTLDRFNDELAILDRPLEGDVEYDDERPRSRWRWAATVIVAVALLGGGTYALALRLLALRPPPAEATPASPARVAPAPPPPTLSAPGEPPGEDPPAPGSREARPR